MSHEHGTILFAWGFISLFGVLITWLNAGIGSEGDKRYWRRIRNGFLVFALTGWLFMPWVWYGSKQVYLWNVGHINDLEAPVQVLPPAPVIRPSAADGVEK